ncbi:sortase [Candidatus Dojkabacteria bacterium]|nr:sortase [Candidatus Dojkabacteria bacterium]
MTKKSKLLNKILNIYTLIGFALIALSLVFLLTPSLPYLWYLVNKGATDQEIDSLVGPVQPRADPEISFEDIIKKYEENYANEDKVKLPELDKSLTKKNTLIIPNIGVNGEIHEGTNAEKTLEKGIWRVNDYGTPEDKVPIILAAHRFGYITWSWDFRKKDSFYYLPKTKVGDKVEIIWKQRKYKYEIYKAEENTQIKDYNADLILYTCKLFNSPVRVFRYAKRVN